MDGWMDGWVGEWVGGVNVCHERTLCLFVLQSEYPFPSADKCSHTSVFILSEHWSDYGSDFMTHWNYSKLWKEISLKI